VSGTPSKGDSEKVTRPSRTRKGSPRVRDLHQVERQGDGQAPAQEKRCCPAAIQFPKLQFRHINGGNPKLSLACLGPATSHGGRERETEKDVIGSGSQHLPLDLPLPNSKGLGQLSRAFVGEVHPDHFTRSGGSERDRSVRVTSGGSAYEKKRQNQ
jgi:hypothetical protein